MKQFGDYFPSTERDDLRRKLEVSQAKLTVCNRESGLQRRVMRAVGIFVARYKEQPTEFPELVRNGDKINAAMGRIVREWAEYEKLMRIRALRS